MKKFKYKVGQEVFIDGSDNRCCIIRKRKVIDGIAHYLISAANFWDWEGAGWKFNKDIFDVGFRNFPRKDNYLPEDVINENALIEPSECGNNGCEIITNLLEEKEIEIPEEDKKIVEEIKFYNKCIERSQTLINSYGDAIYALQKSIEEECININKLKNKIAVLTEDDVLYASTFIDTIED